MSFATIKTFTRGRRRARAAGPGGPTRSFNAESRARERVTSLRVGVRMTIQIILQTNPEKNLFTI